MPPHANVFLSSHHHPPPPLPPHRGRLIISLNTIGGLLDATIDSLDTAVL